MNPETETLQEEKTEGPTTRNPFEMMLQSDNTKRRFAEVLGKKSVAFMSSLLSAYNTNSYLQECEPATILSSAMIAATLDLPINSNLGFAAVVPYKGKAQFQMMYKGFIQLCLRSGQYSTMNAAPVYDGQLVSNNPFTGEIKLNADGKKSDKVVGYVAYEKLMNGFEKFLYITKEKAEEHGKKYSQSYQKGKGIWVDNFDAMALKTVVKMLLSKWGIMTVELQRAIEFDQAVVVDGKPVYIDTGITHERTTVPQVQVEIPATGTGDVLHIPVMESAKRPVGRPPKNSKPAPVETPTDIPPEQIKAIEEAAKARYNAAGTAPATETLPDEPKKEDYQDNGFAELPEKKEPMKKKVNSVKGIITRALRLSNPKTNEVFGFGIVMEVQEGKKTVEHAYQVESQEYAMSMKPLAAEKTPIEVVLEPVVTPLPNVTNKVLKYEVVK